MKSKILLVFIALCTIVACTPKEAEKSTTVGMFTPFFHMPPTLNGQLKEVLLTVRLAEDTEGVVTPGRIMTKIEVDSLGLINPTKILFNEDGNVLMYESLDDMGVAFNTYKLNYEDGLMISATIYNGDMILREDIVESYELGYPDKISTKNMETGREFNYDLDFNEIGQYIKLVYMDSIGTIISIRDFTWDETNHIIRYSFTNSEGVVLRYSKHTYDTDGYSYKRELFNESDSLIWKSENRAVEWDDMGNPTGFAFSMNGELTCYDQYTYIYY